MEKLLLILILFTGTLNAQEFRKHRWEHRLLVIFTTEFNTPEVQEQLKIFQLGHEHLVERKVLVYTISEEKYRFGFSDTKYTANRKRQITKPFEIVLIGLDGGQKYRSDEVQPIPTFNEIIDRMPMRLNELRKKNK